MSRRPSRQAAPLDEAALYEYAVKALGRRMRSVAELERLMRAKVEHDATGESKIAAVVARLEEQRYLDDAAFASVFTRLRQENEGFGKLRVERELTRKGVSRNLIASTLDTAYEKTSEEELARSYLARKRIAKPQNQAETARVVRRLTAAGFSIPTLVRILKNWEIECSEEDLTPPEDAG